MTGDRRWPIRPTTVGLSGVVAFGHVLYPTWLLATTRGRAAPAPPEPRSWPSVTVVVPAYREGAIIADKVADVQANGYAGEVDVLVVADDAGTARAAEPTGATVLAPGRRLGKAAAINLGCSRARGDIVVLTDANAMFAPGSLGRLVRWFEDPTVTGVAGEKRVRGGGESLYWRFESALKRAEVLQGTTIGLVGEIAALRRASFRPLPERLAVDDLWLALDLIESGGRIVYEPEAVAFEDPSATWQELWERRTRVVSGVLDVLWRRRRLLAPGHGPVTAQLWGHRFVRSSAGPIAHVLLVASAAAASRRSWSARAFLAGNALAGVALRRRVRGHDISAPERVLAELAFLQVVALGGVWRYCRGDRPALWPKADRGTPPPAA
jgi:poly-beta-1,6-N-acetyl-D-glucosamine synthase